MLKTIPDKKYVTRGLYHYTEKPFQIDPNFQIDPERAGILLENMRVGIKPIGLWLSVDFSEYNWPSWCLEEGFGFERLRYRNKIHLSDKANILYLESDDEILEFSEQFHNENTPLKLRGYIDWTKVASQYDGIIISSYSWGLRCDLRTLWYYGWDCASGCVWNTDVLKVAHSMELTIPELRKIFNIPKESDQSE